MWSFKKRWNLVNMEDNNMEELTESQLSLEKKRNGEFGDLSDILLSPNSNSKLYQNDQIATKRHS